MKQPSMATKMGAAALAVALALFAADSRAQDNALEQNFLSPPSQAYPEGHLSISTNLDTVRADLARQRQANVHDLGMGPDEPRDAGAYMSPARREAVAASAAVAHAMGFEIFLPSSPGFSHSGDSRVQPDEAMKKLVWSETMIEGGRDVDVRLSAPPNTSGPYQSIPYFSKSPWTLATDVQFYRDVAVLAYRVNAATPLGAPQVTSSAGALDAARLAAEDAHNPILLDSAQGPAWIQLDYAQPQTIRTAVLATPETRFERSIVAELSARRSDGSYVRVATFNMRSCAHLTLSFAPVTSDSFQISFHRLAADDEPLVPQDDSEIDHSGPPIPLPFALRRPENLLAISGFALAADGRVNEFEKKAGFFTFVSDYYALGTDPQSINAATPRADVIDLTRRVSADGALHWRAPPGNWRILRLGYSLTGKVNHPAPPDATGLEADKLSATHMRAYFNRYLDGMLPAGGDARQAFGGLFADSIESSPQNWTEDMLTQFRRRRGYDATPFLPVLTGAVIDSAETSDRFLWDFRQTISELGTENTFGVMQAAANARALRTRVQALEQGRHQLGNDFAMRRYADEPMGALWGSAPLVDYLDDFPNQIADIRGAASVAHVYGRRIVASESGTSLSYPGAFSLRISKQLVDLEYALGVNWVGNAGVQPGALSAPYTADWLRYLARSSYMLQQGQPVADVAYFFGQDAPLVALRQRLADTPRDYAFDFIDSDALLRDTSVSNGALITRGGARYRLLQLGGNSRMLTVAALRRLKALAQAGLVIAGEAPDNTPSLSDDQAEFLRLRSQLWGPNGDGTSLGAGRIVRSSQVAEALQSMGIAPDLIASPGTVGRDVLFAHRSLGADGELYYVMGRLGRSGPVDLSFRQTGRAPEIWRADSGEIAPASYRIENGRTIVPIDFHENDAFFVVFRRSAVPASLNIASPASTAIATLNEAWTVRFPQTHGGPAQPVTLRAGSWTASQDRRIKYFSGTATYSRTIRVPAEAAGSRIVLSLGEVEDVAEVLVNGSPAGVRWTPPYRFDITSAVRPGDNQIEIRVTNRMINRMIGDRQPGATPLGGYFGAAYRPDAELRRSGLIGPVTLRRESAPAR